MSFWKIYSTRRLLSRLSSYSDSSFDTIQIPLQQHANRHSMTFIANEFHKPRIASLVILCRNFNYYRSRYNYRNKPNHHFVFKPFNATADTFHSALFQCLNKNVHNSKFKRVNLEANNTRSANNNTAVTHESQPATMARHGKGKLKQNKSEPDEDKQNKDKNISVTSQKPKLKGINKFQQLLKVPTKINVVVIGTGGPGNSKSILITTEYSRYLFNCGEGTQRHSGMNKELRSTAFAKLAGLETIFFTYKSWENTGGLMGMTMTLEGQKNPAEKNYKLRGQNPSVKLDTNPHITIYGPPDVEKITSMAKKFAHSTNLNIVKGDGVYEDFCLTITPVPFYADLLTSEEDKNDLRSPRPAKRVKTDSTYTSKSRDVAYAYIIKAKPLSPKINVEKCLDAGITIGPMVGKLQRGESVVLEDGRVVRPEQVTDNMMCDDRPFLILECPRKEFIDSLSACSELEGYLRENTDQAFSLVVHMSPLNVYNSEEYQSWMNRLHKSTDHLVMNKDSPEAAVTRVLAHQARLNLVDTEIFPLLPVSDTPASLETLRVSRALLDTQSESNTSSAASKEVEAKENIYLKKKGEVMLASSGLVYVCRGKELGFHMDIAEFSIEKEQKYCLDNPDISAKLTVLKKSSLLKSQDLDNDQDNLTSYPKVVFLGTGSSEPNRIRAQSCILVQLSKSTIIILDCGEDSYGQLFRFYGKAKVKRILRKTKAIFVSHMHADHHLGLFSLVKERKLAFDEKEIPFVPVLLISPIQMKRWLKFYHTEQEPIISLFRFVKIQQGFQDCDTFSVLTATMDDVKKELDFTEFTPIAVDHIINAYGVAFRHANGYKLVYSGDTRPCKALIEAGANCDLLIHEATHEDNLLPQALSSKHSTFSEAIDVGKQMMAKHIILTHFSQRYPHMVPLFDLTLPENVGLAFDNMQVCPRTLGRLPKAIPALEEIFSDELQKLVIKNLKRLREKTEAENDEILESRS
ncbi:ribonuclease Z, mitochondrial-like [Physella acuta]|uniref:ribonuclease Z, mitochondrial-like n=1 Tax=Physella acuta TaxID=109671 RepID=UPI0027DC86F2|nr:ribonuclease Z, mitochondrial-like [Physella acuta]